MYIEIDYTKMDEIVLAEANAEDIKIIPPARFLEEVYEQSALYQSQFERIPSQKEKAKLLWFFINLLEIADVQGGCVILDINEKSNTAILKLRGQQLYINDVANNISLVVFSAIFKNYDEVHFDVVDGNVQMTIFAHLYDEVKVCDKSEEIHELRKRQRERRAKERNHNDE